MKRATVLTTYDLHRLDQLGRMIREGFDEYPYLVGSAGERADYRDVDVRLILGDDDFDGLFAKRSNLWGFLSFVITAWLRAETGLPIDFQIQRQAEANERFGDQSRNPLGTRGSTYAGLGDATNLDKARQLLNDTASSAERAKR